MSPPPSSTSRRLPLSLAGFQVSTTGRFWVSPEDLIAANRNVRLVFCGHDDGVAVLSTFRPDGSLVHQVLTDYQWLYQGTPDYAGGSGYLRLVEFDYARRELRVRTYSPYLDRYLTDPANQFPLSLDLDGHDKSGDGLGG